MKEKRKYTRLDKRIKEKRQHIRVETECECPIEVQIMGDIFLEVLNAKDISTTGIGVHVSHEFRGYNIEDEVNLILTLSNEIPFNAKGVIIHSNVTDKGYFSIEFTGISSENKKMIYDYVYSRLFMKKSSSQ